MPGANLDASQWRWLCIAQAYPQEQVPRVGAWTNDSRDRTRGMAAIDGLSYDDAIIRHQSA